MAQSVQMTKKQFAMIFEGWVRALPRNMHPHTESDLFWLWEQYICIAFRSNAVTHTQVDKWINPYRDID